MARRLGPAVAVLCFAGCGVDRLPAPVNARLALNSSAALREAFNSGACGSIFDRADPVFQRSQQRGQWVSDCSQLRDQLGVWTNFAPRVSGRGVGPTHIVLSGRAVFSRGERRVTTVWSIDGSRYQLFSLRIETDAEVHSFPRPVQPRRWLTDPPVKRNSEPS